MTRTGDDTTRDTGEEDGAQRDPDDPDDPHTPDGQGDPEAIGLASTLFLTEYSPRTQLEVLHISACDLPAPVLDLGCGREGRLVRWLRDHGKAAVGIDLGAEAGPGLVAGNWFEADLGVETWGSIVSHMAFSSYFMHSHLRHTGEARRCAARYMAILAALVPGGAFYYAPGLPFMEHVLTPNRFEVSRQPLEALQGRWLDRVLADLFGKTVLYAARVVRRCPRGQAP